MNRMRVLSNFFVELAVPVACAWVKKQEAVILRTGAPLSPAQLGDARRIGLTQPELVRVLLVDVIPPHLHPVLRYLARKFGMSFAGTIGMALGRGILLRREHREHRALVLHELAHVAQYERLGFREFLRQYLRECLTIGYPLGPLEAEAREVTHRLSAPA
jgi:hypothetical protein